jgi:hypothetical protein
MIIEIAAIAVAVWFVSSTVKYFRDEELKESEMRRREAEKWTRIKREQNELIEQLGRADF